MDHGHVETVDGRFRRGLAYGLLLVAPFWAAVAAALLLALR